MTTPNLSAYTEGTRTRLSLDTRTMHVTLYIHRRPVAKSFALDAAQARALAAELNASADLLERRSKRPAP